MKVKNDAIKTLFLFCNNCKHLDSVWSTKCSFCGHPREEAKKENRRKKRNNFVYS